MRDLPHIKSVAVADENLCLSRSGSGASWEGWSEDGFSTDLPEKKGDGFVYYRVSNSE